MTCARRPGSRRWSTDHAGHAATSTAVTHANDMSGRFVELEVASRSGNTAWLKAPANANLAQPGYYMLFAVDANGVPSVATWVHLGPMTYGG